MSQCKGIGDQLGELGNNIDSAFQVLQRFIIWGMATQDPNEIRGQNGYAEKKWVSVKSKLGYSIFFENDGQFANAPAQNVYIYFPVPDALKLNINSLKLGSFGFGKYDFQVPENLNSYTQRLDLRDSLGIYVDVTAGINIANKEVFWFLKSIDPYTGIAPNYARGFLAVSDTGEAKLADSTHKGQGYVNFYITPKAESRTGDTIAAQASIVFDYNEALPTNVWPNAIDAVAPSSKINAHAIKDNIILLSWAGQDDAGGSGLLDYELYASEDEGPFTLYRAAIKETAATYAGTPGKTYSFFTLATDNTGNKETLKKAGELSVTLEGEVLPVKWLYFKGQPQGKDVQLNWATATEINTKEFVIERSLDGRIFNDLGTIAAANRPVTNNYQYLDLNAMLQKVSIIYYRLRQIDLDGKYVHSGVIAIPIQQTVAEPKILAYPNPFQQSLTLQIINVTSSDKTDRVLLYSIDGRLVYNRNLGNMGSSTILLQDLPMLASGVYLLKASINGKLYTVKLLKQ